MRRQVIQFLAAAAIFGVTACRDDTLVGPPPTSRADALVPTGSVQATTFYFLTPLGSAKGGTELLDVTQSPVVTICLWQAGACVGLPVARYSMTTNPAIQIVDKNFKVVWRPSADIARPGMVFRVRVSSGGYDLGDAYVGITPAGTDRNDESTVPTIPGGASLTIRFRIVATHSGMKPPAVTPASIVTTIAGTGVAGFAGEGGQAINAQLNGPSSLVVAPDGSYYISNSGFNAGRVQKVEPGGIITTVVGTIGAGGCSGDGGPATSAQLIWPHGDVLAPDGSLYIADYGCGILWRVGTNGTINRVAGGLGGGFSGDGGPAALAKVTAGSLALGLDGSLYLTDNTNNRVRRIDSSGTITTVAGNGGLGSTGDGGPAILAQLADPNGIAVGPDGSLYITENQGHRIRRVDPAGMITTIAGTGTSGFTGDGGPATSALISHPYTIVYGPDDALYFSDFNNHAIRRVGPDGVISTVAGTGNPGFGGDGGPSGMAQFWYPGGLAFTSDGALLVADQYNNRVRRIK